MRDLLSATDLVVISFATSLLDSAGIPHVVFDRNISAVEGGIGAFPQRLAVDAEDWPAASRLLQDAGLGDWIRRDE